MSMVQRQGTPVLQSVEAVIESVRNKGVRLWSENGELRYRASKGLLSSEEIDRLRAFKPQIVTFLAGATPEGYAQPDTERLQQFDRAPLTFSQLAHWNSFALKEAPAVRQIASATCLRGRLDVAVLRECLTEMIWRHQALRTQIVVADGPPLQEISQSGHCRLEFDDLTRLPPGERDAEVRRVIERHILEPTYLGRDPLFGVRLARIQDLEHILIIAMEHIVSDAFSMNILLRDLFTAYKQARRGASPSLPAIAVQYADYAVWQSSAEVAWRDQYGPYWVERLAGCPKLQFPRDISVPGEIRLGRAMVPVRFENALKSELAEWCRLRHTTPAMAIFTAYVGCVLRWCSTPEGVIRYQTDGRSPKVENTIGYFAAVLNLRVGLGDQDTFIDLLERVTGEYCAGREHADMSYLDAQLPPHPFTLSTGFNWIPRGFTSGLSLLSGADDAVVAAAFPFAFPARDNYPTASDPTILLYDTDDGIAGGVHFPLNRFAVATIEIFCRNFVRFVEALVRRPMERVSAVPML
jgi:hypothetical protein